MPRDFFDPTPEQQIVVLVNSATLRKAERLIESCEARNPKGADIPFDNILDRVTGSDPSVCKRLDDNSGISRVFENVVCHARIETCDTVQNVIEWNPGALRIAELRGFY